MIDIVQYGMFGAGRIVSPLIESIPLLPGKILSIRTKARDFGEASPLGKRMLEEIKEPQYQELRALLSKSPLGMQHALIQNLADASIFAGLVGTSTISMNCLMQVARGPEFVRMFRANHTAFLLEVARTATPVAGSAQVLRAPQTVTTANVTFTMPEGAMVFQMTGMSAGVDASVFPDRSKFDSGRANLGEAMNWNG